MADSLCRFTKILFFSNIQLRWDIEPGWLRKTGSEAEWDGEAQFLLFLTGQDYDDNFDEDDNFDDDFDDNVENQTFHKNLDFELVCTSLWPVTEIFWQDLGFVKVFEI